MFLAIFKKNFHTSVWIIMRATPESNRSVQDCRSYKIFERKFQQVQKQLWTITLLITFFLIEKIINKKKKKSSAVFTCSITEHKLDHFVFAWEFSNHFRKTLNNYFPKLLKILMEWNILNKILFDLWFLFPNIKVAWIQMTEIVSENLCSSRWHS